MADKAKDVPLPEEIDEEQIIRDEVDSEGEGEEVSEEEQDQAFVVESQESVAEEVGMESEYLIESQEQHNQSSRPTQVTEVDDAAGRVEVEKAEVGESEKAPEDLGEEEELVEDGTGRVDEKPEFEEERIPRHSQEESEDGVCQQERVEIPEASEDEESGSIELEEIRLVGDLPPSPYLVNKVETTSPKEDSEPAETDRRSALEEEDVDEDLSIETVAPSSRQESQTPASPLPDVSVALDTLVLTSDASETSLLADATLPASPIVAPTPCPARFESSTPSPVTPGEDLFPTPIQQPVISALPPLSPESCQTASIVLETPPRLDDSPAQLRLPGRPVIALNFPGRAAPAINIPASSAKGGRSVKKDQISTEIRKEDESVEIEPESEDELDHDSPSRKPTTTSNRAVPLPTPSKVPSRQRQPVFFPESASFTDDAETSFDQDETDEDDADISVEYEVPLNDAKISADYDDSDLGEGENDEEELLEDQGTPKAHSKNDTDQSVGEVVDRRAPEPVSYQSQDEEDDSRFELEQPELRFHDETESEPEVTIEEDEDVREEKEAEAEEESVEKSVVEQPNVLKRSLRSRVVTVDLQATKTPGRSRSREILSEMQS